MLSILHKYWIIRLLLTLYYTGTMKFGADKCCTGDGGVKTGPRTFRSQILWTDH